MTKAQQIVQAIENDISGRKGIGDELDAIDSGIREEMLTEWLEIVNRILNKE